ncbi:hypothetical protein E2I00_008900, partial [Balaenoptera physalus]
VMARGVHAGAVSVVAVPGDAVGRKLPRERWCGWSGLGGHPTRGQNMRLSWVLTVLSICLSALGKLEDGTEFDSSLPQNQPFVFSLGTGQVIKGWDQGLLGMCEGEKRKLVIPSELGYGERGAPPKIPGGATLVFEVELLKIERRSEL